MIETTVVGSEPHRVPQLAPAAELPAVDPEPAADRNPSFLDRVWRLPAEIWSWQATLAVVLLVAAPPVVSFQLTPQATTLAQGADIVGLFLYPAVLTCALHLYFHWRLTNDAAAGRLAVLLFAGAVQGLSMVTLRIGYAEAIRAHAFGLLLVDLLFAVVALVLMTTIPRGTPRFDPGVLGVLLGTVVSLLRVAIVTEPRVLHPEPAVIVLLGVAVLVLHLLLAPALLRLRPLPGWARGRLAVAFVLLSVNRATAYPGFDARWESLVAIVTDLLGAILLVNTSVALLRRSTRRRGEEIEYLRSRIHDVEHDVLGERERLHEIGATVAGIACATRLMQEWDELPAMRREQLEHMVGSEIERLARLMDDQVQDDDDVELDEIVGHLVTAQQALGRSACYTPSGLRVHGRTDELTEVIHILLDNAARHAPGAPVTVSSVLRNQMVEVRVHDAGPGIPRDLAENVFSHGFRGEHSTGQGIGLHMATRIMDTMGGSLHLLPASRGATFVVRMPKARTTHDASHAAAQ